MREIDIINFLVQMRKHKTKAGGAGWRSNVVNRWLRGSEWVLFSAQQRRSTDMSYNHSITVFSPNVGLLSSVDSLMGIEVGAVTKAFPAREAFVGLHTCVYPLVGG